jgi:molybdate transport system substrate-binding protein
VTHHDETQTVITSISIGGKVSRRLCSLILSALVIVSVAACSSAKPKTLTVFAAASLTESFGDIGKQFEAAHPGVKVVFNFAGSQQLRAQLEQGAHADIFASANSQEMNAAIAASLVVSGTQRTFARNQLVVIYPKSNPSQIAALTDLARPGLKLDIADPSVPVGQYSLDMLGKMSRDPAFGSDFRDRVMANVVSREENVKAVVSKVRLGEADAGVVYTTDVTREAAKELGTLDVPDKFNVIATYPIAPLANAFEPELARQFVDFVLSPTGQQVMVNYGFIRVQSNQL